MLRSSTKAACSPSADGSVRVQAVCVFVSRKKGRICRNTAAPCGEQEVSGIHGSTLSVIQETV